MWDLVICIYIIILISGIKLVLKKLGVSDNSISYPVIYDDFPGSTLNTEYWTEEINGGSGTVTVSGGNCTLDPQDNVSNNAAIKSTQSGYVRLKTRIKSTATDNSYLTLSLGSGALVGIGGPTNWWLTTFYNGYASWLYVNTNAKLFRVTRW